MEHTHFLHKEFTSVVANDQWIVLMYLVARNLTILRLRPLRVKEESYR